MKKRSTRTWRSRLWEKCLLVYHTLFYRSLGEHRDALLAWVIHEMIWTFLVDFNGENEVKSNVHLWWMDSEAIHWKVATVLSTSQYYCWWLFYPALANRLIGSYFSHGCVHSKCSTKSWIPLNKVHSTHLGSIYLHCCFGVWHFVILLRSGTFAWSHKLIFSKAHIAYQTPDFWQVNEIVWLLLKTTTTERFRSRLSAKKPELSVPMAILIRNSPTSCLVHFIAYGQQFWKNSNVRFCDLHVYKTNSHVSFICNISICFGYRCKAARTGK